MPQAGERVCPHEWMRYHVHREQPTIACRVWRSVQRINAWVVEIPAPERIAFCQGNLRRALLCVLDGTGGQRQVRINWVRDLCQRRRRGPHHRSGSTTGACACKKRVASGSGEGDWDRGRQIPEGARRRAGRRAVRQGPLEPASEDQGDQEQDDAATGAGRIKGPPTRVGPRRQRRDRDEQQKHDGRKHFHTRCHSTTCAASAASPRARARRLSTTPAMPRARTRDAGS